MTSVRIGQLFFRALFVAITIWEGKSDWIKQLYMSIVFSGWVNKGPLAYFIRHVKYCALANHIVAPVNNEQFWRDALSGGPKTEQSPSRAHLMLAIKTVASPVPLSAPFGQEQKLTTQEMWPIREDSRKTEYTHALLSRMEVSHRLIAQFLLSELVNVMTRPVSCTCSFGQHPVLPRKAYVSPFFSACNTFSGSSKK